MSKLDCGIKINKALVIPDYCHEFQFFIQQTIRWVGIATQLMQTRPIVGWKEN